MSFLRFTPMKYDPADLARWKRGNYRWFRNSKASAFIIKIICTKARTRRRALLASGREANRRFFGEAFVAAKLPHDEGWFGSFKILTARPGNRRAATAGGFRHDYAAAVDQHLSAALPALRECALRCEQDFQVRPVMPDLWLRSKGKQRFIEVKLPGDSLNDRQLAGFAVLATACKLPLSLEVVTLYPSGTSPKLSWIVDAEKRYKDFCSHLARA